MQSLILGMLLKAEIENGDYNWLAYKYNYNQLVGDRYINAFANKFN